ncbi:MAG: hypothetical protein DA328_05145 [Nitrososphaeraceae archaeon]|nr:hypothetical protein [Nitrososphaeraceae archaeon]
MTTHKKLYFTYLFLLFSLFSLSLSISSIIKYATGLENPENGETVTLKTKLIPSVKTNEFLFSTNTTFLFSPESKICPMGDCIEEFFNGLLLKSKTDPEIFSITGILKIKNNLISLNNNSFNYYQIFGTFQIHASYTSINKDIVQVFKGKLGMGLNDFEFAPKFNYSVNGTFSEPSDTLILTGKSID